MPKITTESTFEEHIEQFLVKDHKLLPAKQEDYDKKLCLRPKTVIEFIRATQTKQWKAYCDLVGDKEATAANVLKRVKDVIEREGTLHALRHGIDVAGAGHFDLCYFEPSQPAATEGLKLSQQNLFHVQRQVKFSEADEKSLDMVIFLNGLPIFTLELKNQISGQNVVNAIKQYRDTRDPKEPLFRFKRCLAHFAVDNNEAYVSTELAGAKTVFLPFNQGDAGGAGNPPCKTGYATSYLWKEIWSKESILNLIQRFIRVVDLLDDKGKKTDKKRQIFPRYHQLNCVRELAEHAASHGAGRRYLNQHSAGSGKTNCIAWLASNLATLHGAKDGKPVFSTVIVISDRRVIDRQLQRTLTQVIETKGMLINIAADEGMTSRHLKDALEDGKRIVVTTLQKFGKIVESMNDLPGETFAVIVDEAHSSQSGEGARDVQKVLSYSSLGEKKNEEEETPEDRIIKELGRSGPQKNVSYFAFTATPKAETLELFGTKDKSGGFRPFSLYTMRQAIEEGFILDVLLNYATYDQYWGLLKKVDDDPEFDSAKAKTLLRQFVSRHEQTIEKKARIMVDHFVSQVSGKLGGKAKAMIVTASRLHAVRYKLAVDAYLRSIGSPFKALVAFTDTVKDPKDKKEYTEASMNSFPESMTADRFEADENRFLIVASKFQTGFDQPKLLAMYVDKKLRGVACVQTLSRLNRTCQGKNETFVLDFENSDSEIEKAFQPFYDRIALSKETDPNTLYNIRTDLAKFAVHDEADAEAFGAEWFAAKPRIEILHSLTDPIASKWLALDEEEQVDYKSKARDFVKLFSFLSGILPIRDQRLAKLFALLRFLLPKLPAKKGELPTAVLGMVDMEKLAIRKNDPKKISLKRDQVKVDPLNYGAGADLSEEEKAALSKIIEDLNMRFNTTFTQDEIMVIKQLEKKISEDEALQQQLTNGSRDAVKATFLQVAEDAFEDLMSENIKFYKKVNGDEELAKEFFTKLFDWYKTKKEPAKSSKKSKK